MVTGLIWYLLKDFLNIQVFKIVQNKLRKVVPKKSLKINFWSPWTQMAVNLKVHGHKNEH